MLPKDITNTAKEYILALHHSFGPLKRTTLGDWSVQGIDFVYTLQGWIKGVNGDGVGKDVGEDGIGASPLLTAKDAMSYALGYFENDYKPVGLSGANLPFSGQSALTGVRNLYNGNISSMVTALQGLPTLGSVYQYDQLNRIKSAEYHQKFNAASNTWTNENDYGNSYTYDANGNILNLQRKSPNGQSGNEMDKLTYHYQPGTNKLTHVSDLVPDSEFTMDIDDQQIGNYQYDEIGNLVTDHAEGLRMEWTPSGKLSRVVNSKKHNELNFGYDGMGNRYKKQVATTLDPNDPNSSKDTKTEYYVRDASGNVMAIYQLENDFRVDESLLEGVFASLLAHPNSQVASFIQQHLLSNAAFAKLFFNEISSQGGAFLADKNLEYFLHLEPTLARLLVQTQFPSPHPKWIGGMVSRNLMLIPRAMVDCGHGRSMLTVQSMDNFLVWLGGKLTQHETTLTSPFFALGQQLEILYGPKDPNIDYYNYLKALITVQNIPYNNLLDVLVNQYRAQGNTWMEVYFTEYFVSTILPTLMNGNLLRPHVADALANCSSLNELVNYFKTSYQSVLFGDIPVTKTLLEQIVYTNSAEQLAWLSAYLAYNVNGAATALSNFFYQTNMSVKQLLLNIKATFGEQAMNDAAIQLQPMQNLREVIRYRLSEQPIYGSTRLGVRNLERNAVFANYLFEKKHPIAEPEDPAHPLLVKLPNPAGNLATPLEPQPEYSLTLGYKQYELTNHLGNVNVTLSDRKLGVVQNENSTFASYIAEVLSAVDYYPFGMAMPGRSGEGGYRYGFNGYEKDNEIKDSGNSYDFGARIYDPRLGRFLSEDPRFKDFPDFTIYGSSGNNPIKFFDEDGEGPFLPSLGLTNTVFRTIDWIKLKHQQGITNVNLAEEARQIDIKNKGTSSITNYTKALMYLAPFWNAASPFLDANDVSVVLKGKNLDGTKADNVDIKLAGVGLFLPFVSGGKVRELLKNFEVKSFNKSGIVYNNSNDFYKMTNNISVGERSSIYIEKASEVAEKNGWVFNKQLSKKNGNRIIYTDNQGFNYSLDKRHGRFEITNMKGTHQGEVNFFGEKTKEADPNGGHDLILK